MVIKRRKNDLFILSCLFQMIEPGLINKVWDKMTGKPYYSPGIFRYRDHQHPDARVIPAFGVIAGAGWIRSISA
jgi:hypothetical protein